MQYKKSDYIGETRPDIRTVRGQRRGKTDLLAQESDDFWRLANLVPVETEGWHAASLR